MHETQQTQVVLPTLLPTLQSDAGYTLLLFSAPCAVLHAADAAAVHLLAVL
jgi:hypothetical protein